MRLGCQRGKALLRQRYVTSMRPRRRAPRMPVDHVTISGAFADFNEAEAACASDALNTWGWRCRASHFNEAEAACASDARYRSPCS